MTTKEAIDSLEERIRTIAEMHSRARIEIDKLQKINTERLAKIRALQEDMRRDKEEIARMRLSMALGGGRSDKTAARAQVNRLLREVDKCIAVVASDVHEK